MRIIYTSDIHSYLFSTSYAEERKKNMGYYRIINSYKKDKDTVVIDGGDNIQGSALSKFVMDRKLFNPFPQAEAMRKGGVDFVVPGNHDFNYGYEVFNEFISQIGAQILCSNLIDKSGNMDILPHVVKSFKGLRVGFAGIVTDWVNVWEKKENLELFEVTDARKAAERELKWLKDNADVSVLIYHGGFEGDLKTGEVLQDNGENIAYSLCRDLSYDLILTAHQHRALDFTDLFGTKTLQCPAFAQKYAEIEITKDGIRGGLKDLIDEEPEYEKDNEELGDAVEHWLDSKIGTIDKEIEAPSGIDSALNGNHIADFFNYIQLEATSADISCVALNNNLYSFNKTMTVRQILASYQYPNSLCVIEVGEKELRGALERCAEFFSFENGLPVISKEFLIPKAEMYNYDYYMGIEYTFDISKPKGERVVKLLYKGEPIGNKKLKLVLNNYRITGAGGYPMFPKCKVINTYDWDVQDLSVEYFAKHRNEVISWPYSNFSTEGWQK